MLRISFTDSGIPIFISRKDNKVISPEKSDVSIDKLFQWGREFTIVGLYGKEQLPVSIRLVGDAELNRSRVFAIRKSAELRKKLRTEDTDERVAFIASVYDIDSKDELIELLTTLKIREFAQDAYREVKVPFPKEPRSDAKLEEFEKFQAEVDNFDEKRNKLINEYIFSRVDDYHKSLVKESIDYLRKEYERVMINNLCEQEMVKRFKEHCVYAGCYKDSEFKIRLFDSFDEFDNLNSQVKEQFISSYEMLEIDMDTLKKSLEATP
jgi:hypothetical protein